jgi:protein-tyrosine phosphatase
MPPNVIDLQKADDSRDVVHRAVQELAEGRLVAFPTETVYGLAASGLNEAAVRRLREVKQRGADHPMALAVRSAEEAWDYVPQMSQLACRLARRCWPGPVTLVVDDDHPDSLIQQLPAVTREAVSPSGTIGLRAPAHESIQEVLKMLAGPLVLTSANRGGGPESVSAEQVVEALGDDVALVLDDGKCRFGAPSSVVRVQGNEYEMLRTGVVPPETVRRLASMMVLLVCTGNTCRSPMAEILFKQKVAARLKCQLEEVDQHGMIVMSAGIAAMAGGRPSAEAVNVMNKVGLDLSQHESQPLTQQLVEHADHIFTMTRSHRDAIVAQWPSAASRTRLVCSNEQDVSDPIGGTEAVYEQCSQQLDKELDNRLNELEI